MEEMTLNKWVGKFINGDFNDKNVHTQIFAGWYNWFCKDESLARKTQKLGKKIIQLLKSDKIDGNRTYVVFKNNCPVNGRLYDVFRICDIETCEIIYTITPSSGRLPNMGSAEVWGRENDFIKPLVEGTWKDVKDYFGV